MVYAGCIFLSFFYSDDKRLDTKSALVPFLTKKQKIFRV